MTFYEGFSFGEKASKNEERRAATCVATEDCFCGLIDRASYFKVLKKLQDE
jgi:CRP-like cAMP-binding protein